MRVATVSSRCRVELDAGLLGLAQDAHERELDRVQQVLEAAFDDQRALCLRELVREHRARGERVTRLGGDPALLAQLLQRIAAAGRVEQVGGDRGVEDEVGRDLGERLGVVRDHGAVADGGDHVGGRVDLARERDVPARVGREAPLGLARDQLALGDLGREDRQREELALQARDVARVAGRAGLDLDLLEVRGARDRLQLGLGERLFQAAQRVAQLPVAEHLAQVGAVRRLGELDLEVDVQRDVAHHRGQRLAHARVVRVIDQVLLALGARDLVDAGEHAFEVAELLQQVRGGLVADAGDAGDVVGRVALEADEVRDQLGRDAVAVDHGLAVVDLRVRDAAGRGHDPHAVVDELVGVAVAGHDHHGHAALLGLLGEGGDHVVGLVALDRDVRVAEGLYERTEMRPLELQEVRSGAALRLVVGADLLAARHARVPHDDDGHLAEVREDLHEHRREAENGVGRPSVGRRDRLREGEERAVREAVAVDQEQLAWGISVASGHGLDTSGQPGRQRVVRSGRSGRYAGGAASRCFGAPGRLALRATLTLRESRRAPTSSQRSIT